MTNINIQNLSFTYSGEKIPAINEISFSVSKGQCIKIEGNNGSGKSTLAYCLSGIIPNFYKGKIDGKVFINRKNIVELSIAELSDIVGIVMKNPETQLLQPTVEEELAFPLENRALPKNSIYEKINEITGLLKIRNLLHRSVNDLSMGEKQLVVLASVMIVKPSILILDEAFSMLDKCNTKRILNLLKLLKAEGITLIIIDHINSCSEIADKVLYLENGKLKQNL